MQTHYKALLESGRCRILCYDIYIKCWWNSLLTLYNNKKPLRLCIVTYDKFSQCAPVFTKDVLLKWNQTIKVNNGLHLEVKWSLEDNFRIDICSDLVPKHKWLRYDACYNMPLWHSRYIWGLANKSGVTLEAN